MAVVVAVASFMTAGAATAMMAGDALAGTVGGTMISAGAAGFVGSPASQASTGQFSFTTALQGGLTAAVTAGLTNGITYTADSGLGWSGLSGQVSDNSLSALAGVKNVGGALVPQAGTATAGTLLAQGVAIAGEAGIQAGVQTAIQGGSFLTNLKNDAVSDVAAAGAYAIGNLNQNGDLTGLGYVAAHAALGCAASAADGTGCAGGAIGGAVSAATANEIATAVTGGQGVSDQGQLAAIVAATTLLGGAAAGLLGQNVQGAVTAAQNETLNNTCAPGHNCGTLASAVKDTGRAAWNTALGVVQSIPNAVNGALPGYPDCVPFLSGAMLPYDDPDFGSLVSLVGGVGAASLVGRSTGATTATSSSATTTASGADFYVTSNGTAVPATGYRAVGGPAVDEALTGIIASRNPTYITFDNITNMSPSAAQSLLQLPRTPTNWVSFDTLLLINDLTIPTGKWNTTTTLEPITNTFPEWGAGGGTQAITNQPIQVKGFGTLPTGTGK